MYPERVYNEVAGYTLSVWYPADRPMVELEPIGPAEVLAPGAEATFTEHWWLLHHPFPGEGEADIEGIGAQVRNETEAPQKNLLSPGPGRA